MEGLGSEVESGTVTMKFTGGMNCWCCKKEKTAVELKGCFKLPWRMVLHVGTGRGRIDTSLATFLDSLNSCFRSYSLEFSSSFYSLLENSVDRTLMTSENDLEDKFIKVELSVFCCCLL